MARRLVETALMITMVAALAAYLVHHRDLLLRGWALTPQRFGVITACTWLSWLLNTITLAVALRGLGIRVPFGELFGLQVAGGLLNHLPMRAGTLYRARYLKRRSGLLYAHFASLFVMNSLLMIAAAGLTGSIALAATYGLAQPSAVVLFVLLNGCTLAALVALLVPLPEVRATHWFGRAWNDLRSGHAQLRAQSAIIPTLLLMHTLSFGCAAAGFACAYRAVGLEVPLGGCLLLGTIGVLAVYVSITPAGLGINEFVIGAAASLVVAPLATSVLASAVMRGVALLWFVTAGLPALVRSWKHRSPREVLGHVA